MNIPWPWFGFSYFDYVPSELDAVDVDGALRQMLFVKAWELIPDDLKPYSCIVPLFVGRASGFLSGGGVSKSQMRREMLQLSDEHAIPLHPYVRMAYDRFTREWHADMEVPLAELEAMFRDHRYVYGAQIGEMGGEAGFFAEERDYLMSAIRLAAKYDKVITFWDHANLWQQLALDEEFVALIREHADHFIPFWETNGARCAYADQGVPFGLWAGGVTKRWGVNPQAGWYWFEAGYRGPWQGQSMSGSESMAPDVLWAMMCWLGATAGASAFLFEGTEGWFWNFRGKFGESEESAWDPDIGEMKRTSLPKMLALTETFAKVIHPTLKAIVEHAMVPSREEVLARTSVIYQTRWLPDDATPVWNPEMFRRMAWAAGVCENLDVLPAFWAMPVEQKHLYMGHVYPQTYGIECGRELIPHDSRYRWIPVISKHATLPSGTKAIVVGSGDFKTAEDVRAFFATKTLTKDGEGSAWMMCVGRWWAILNSNLGDRIEQTYVVRVGEMTIRGSIDSLVAMIVIEENVGVRVMLNNFIAGQAVRSMEIVFEDVPGEWRVRVNGEDVRTRIDKRGPNGYFSVVCEFNGTAEIVVGEGE